MTGEVIDGELHVMGRPSIAHQNVETEVSADLRRSGGGPGGWLIVPEVELRFPTDELVVPDLTGWRRERIAGRENENPATVEGCRAGEEGRGESVIIPRFNDDEPDERGLT